jgi:hypothetical protein
VGIRGLHTNQNASHKCQLNKLDEVEKLKVKGK